MTAPTGQPDHEQLKHFLSTQLQARKLTSEQFKGLFALAVDEDDVLMRVYRMNRSKSHAKLRKRLLMVLKPEKAPEPHADL